MTRLSEHQLYLLYVPGPAYLGPRIGLPAYRLTQAKAIGNIVPSPACLGSRIGLPTYRHTQAKAIGNLGRTHFCIRPFNFSYSANGRDGRIMLRMTFHGNPYSLCQRTYFHFVWPQLMMFYLTIKLKAVAYLYRVILLLVFQGALYNSSCSWCLQSFPDTRMVYL